MDKGDYIVNSVSEYLIKIASLVEKHPNLTLYFRGQTRKGSSDSGNYTEWKATPSIFRDNQIDKEKEYYSYVMTECAKELNSCRNHCEILSTMQHYGVPTRLLDITNNALVALFFACVSEAGGIYNNENGIVQVIATSSEYIKDYDSDTITILSSLPRFTHDEQNQIKEKALRATKKEDPIKEFNDLAPSPDIHAEEKNISQINQIRRLLHEIKKEKPAFEPLIDPAQILSNYIFTPQKTNPRIIRQSGAFILFGLRDNFLPDYNKDSLLDPCVLQKIEISSKSKIVKTLDQCGISLATMFPELYKVSDYLKNKKLPI